MDVKSKQRFSFSKSPEIESTPKTALQRLKNQFKGQLQMVITKNEATKEEAQQILLNRMNITLDPEDYQTIHFDMKLYQEKYEEAEILGEGCIGLVKCVIRKSDQQKFAVKTVKTDSEEIVRNMILEFKNLGKLSHSNIVKMEELFVEWNEGFQSTGTVCVVMEKIDGREMFEVIQERKNYSEQDARVLFIQILQALEYLHSNYVCHRDLKPNNILCSDFGALKITDFNVSKFSDSYKEFGNLSCHGRIEMWTYTGTVAFSAPEIFTGQLYNEQVDMWSAGVILYVMLSGDLPFSSDYLNDLIEQISSGAYSLTGNIWDKISEDAKDLITHLLDSDPKTRYTPTQALKHRWITEKRSINDIPRDSLRKNMAKLLSVKPRLIDEKRASKMRQLCFLFGAGEVWKRHSLGTNPTSLYDDFRKFKSIEVQPTVSAISVIKDSNKGVYNIDYPFSDSDSEDSIQ